MQVNADLLPVGPADLREALRAGAVDGRERGAAARSRRGRGQGSAAAPARRGRARGAQRRLRPGRGGSVRQGPRAVRRQAGKGRVGSRSDRRARFSSSSMRAACPVLEGWGMTETVAVGTVNRARHLEVRHRRPPAARRRVQDRRRRRDPDQGPERVPGVLAKPRGDPRHVHRRRLADDRRPRIDRRGRLHVDHRPQEGHHHHRRRQEPDSRRTSRTTSSSRAGSRRP